ncbi:MAG: hypothetical protein IJS38_01020 [Erysipelotrichaceae bacterium]|nr:hypothetical protein [Erysipelotrichaceae bacterium]
MKYRRQLFSIKKIFRPGSDGLFVAAVRENVRWHEENNPVYRKILQMKGFTADMLEKIEDLGQLPFIPTMYFKGNDLNTLKKRIGIYTIRTSGTSGTSSAVNCESSALICLLKMAVSTCRQHKLFSLKPVHYVILGYKPDKENKAVAARTALAASLLAPARSRDYVIRNIDGRLEADWEGITAKIRKYSEDGKPVRLIGFPALGYFLMEKLEEKGCKDLLPKGSKMLLGGGWKQYWRQQVDREEFYRQAQEVLGLEKKDIVEFFSAGEHPILYVACPHHHYHIPVYSRVLARDVRTLQPLEKGKKGLLNFITPLMKGAPIVSVVTDDLGSVNDNCPCGNPQPYFEVLGRVGINEIRTCALEAEELAKEER